MDVHKPKAVRSWRELLTEIGVIVLSVCIALAAEQAVEWYHWRKQVAEAREVIATEMARNIGFGIERVRQVRCIDTKLGALAQILDSAARTGMLPPVGAIGSSPVRPWYNGAWDGVVASQTATHFSRQELADLGRVYQFVEQTRTANREEMAAWSSLNAMVGPGRHLDPASETELRKALSLARYYNRLVARGAGQMVRFAQGLHLPFNDGDDRRYLSAFDTPSPSPEKCAALSGKVPSSYGQAPFAAALSELDEYQKHPPYRQFGHATP